MNTEEAQAFIEKLVLRHGSHTNPEQGMCIMETVAFVSGEPFTDHPKCASKVITRLAMRLNDRWSDEQRQKLKPFILRIAGTATDEATEVKRAFMCADWALRELLPIYFDLANLSEWSKKLRSLPGVVDRATADVGRELAREARAEARKEWPAYAAAAVYAAAYAAADAYAAAYAAAYADADADADAAAYAAADAAAYAAAYADAAADAARTWANASVLALLDRIIRVTEKTN